MSSVEVVTLVISGVALVVSICTAAGTATYTQRVTDRRELAKWRRDELLRATSELAQLSSNRQALLSAAFDSRTGSTAVELIDPFDTDATGGPHPIRSVDAMFVLVERIRLIDTAVADAAEQLAQEHQKAVQEAEALPDAGNPVDHIDALMIYPAEQARLHRQLTNAFRKATGQPPIASADDR